MSVTDTWNEINQVAHEPTCQACKNCGLYQKAKTYGIEPMVDSRQLPELDGAPTVVILTKQPSWGEDQSGQNVLCEDRLNRANAKLATLLAHAPFRWVVEKLVRCYPGRTESLSDAQASRGQIEICHSQFLSATLREHSAKAIIAIGTEAFQSVWPGIKSMKAFGVAPRQREDGIWIATLPDMWMGERVGYDQIENQYISVFTNLHAYLTSGVPEAPKYRVITDTTEAIKAVSQLGELVALDGETNEWSKRRQTRTIHHKDTRLLSMGITDDGRNVITLRPPACADPRVYAELVKNREICAHASKADGQMIYALAGGVCIFQAAKIWKKPVLDTVQFSNLRDQSKAGNSLKILAETDLRYPNWSDDLWQQVDANNRAMSERAKQGRARIRKVRHLLRKRILEERIDATYKNGKAYKKKVSRPLTLEEVRELRASINHQRREVLFHSEGAGFDAADANTLDLYNAWDVCAAFNWLKYYRSLPSEERAEDLAYVTAMRITGLCARIERVGVPVSMPHFRALRRLIRTKVQECLKWMEDHPIVQSALSTLPAFEKAEEKGGLTSSFVRSLINVKSPKFFEALVHVTQPPEVIAQIPLTEGGKQMTSSKSVVEMFTGGLTPIDERTEEQRVWHVFSMMRKYRDMSSKFFQAVDNYAVDKGDGWGYRIRPDYIVARVDVLGRQSTADKSGGTATGRISSRDPNGQNFAKDPLIRSVFRARKGKVLVSIDYSSIEPVVLAELCGCAAWIEIFRRGLDLYRCMANAAYKLGIDISVSDDLALRALTVGVKKPLRNIAKVTTLAKAYKEAPESAARRMGIPVEDAIAFDKWFDETYPQIKAWQDELWSKACRGEKIYTSFERKRSFPVTGDPGIDAATDRQLVNYPVQSKASDMNLWLHAELNDELDRLGMASLCEMYEVVHDSGGYEVDESVLNDFLNLSVSVLQDPTRLPFEFNAPLKVEVVVGQNAGAMLQEDQLVAYKHRPNILTTPDLLDLSKYRVEKDLELNKLFAVKINSLDTSLTI